MKKNRFRSFALSLAAAIGFISFANTNVPWQQSNRLCCFR